MLLKFAAFSASLSLFASLPATGQPAPPVIDVHMHAPLPANHDEWIAAMDELNVAKAVFLGTPAQINAPPTSSDRFIPSLMFPCEGGRTPSIGLQCFEDGAIFPALDDLRKWAASGQVQALGELTPQYMGLGPDDPALEPYFALAEELDLPIGLHLGIGPPGVAYEGRAGFPPQKSPNYRGPAGDPMLLENVLLRHPKLRLYVMHAAWPFREELTYMMYMHPELHADVSVLQWAIPRAAYFEHLKGLIDAGFGKRLMFGSDGSAKHLRQGVEAILTADFLTEEQKRDILHDNAARFFRLDFESLPKN